MGSCPVGGVYKGHHLRAQILGHFDLQREDNVSFIQRLHTFKVSLFSTCTQVSEETKEGDSAGGLHGVATITQNQTVQDYFSHKMKTRKIRTSNHNTSTAEREKNRGKNAIMKSH